MKMVLFLGSEHRTFGLTEIYTVDSYITERAVEETAAKWIPENCVIVAISGASAG